MLPAVLLFFGCFIGTAFVLARPLSFALLCDTGFAGLLVGRNFRIAAAEEEATIVFASGYPFVVNPVSLMLLAVATH
jgi:hypothetical protein